MQIAVEVSKGNKDNINSISEAHGKEVVIGLAIIVSISVLKQSHLISEFISYRIWRMLH
jgi:hypothetical protein